MGEDTPPESPASLAEKDLPTSTIGSPTVKWPSIPGAEDNSENEEPLVAPGVDPIPFPAYPANDEDEEK